MQTDESIQRRYDKLKHSTQDNISQYVNQVDKTIENFGFRIRLGDLGSFNVDLPDELNPDNIKNAIVGPINDVINYVNEKITRPMVEDIDNVAARFMLIGKGFKDMANGLFVTEMNGIGDALKTGFDNIGELIRWTGEFIFSYITCGVKFISNFKQCFWPYLLDCFGQTIYIPFRVILWIMLTFFKHDLYALENKIWGQIYSMDDRIYGTFGYRFTNYPKNIRDLCYNCKRLKTDALKDKASEIDYDFTTNFDEKLRAGIKEMARGSDEVNSAFSTDFRNPNPGYPIDNHALDIPNI